MKFGPVPVAKALNAVLAHSVATPSGRLRKGMVLEAPHIDMLRAAGLTEVTVAALDSGDVNENEAAAALARALLAQDAGLQMTDPFTGRVNLLAKAPGVACIDVAAIEAANLVDPMITVATVPPFQQMAEGGMVATIKIISYAVPEAALRKACEAAQSALSLAPPVLQAATLIITEIPGGAGEKGQQAIAARLEQLSVALDHVCTVPHQTDALADALEATETPLVLILTGSATSDIADVAPSAVIAAGGEVARFGMPVDPGNLLFLGRRGDQRVIGLPGCARSPALNGADWVLSRVVCGIEVSATDIARMGVGGLLKEIPTRPQPRRRPPRS